MDPVVALETFLSPFLPFQRPLLVGFSGGRDSSALVKTLEMLKIPHELAHFDHGWRKKSLEEAQMLSAKAKVPFHTMRSNCSTKSELFAREERYQFFASLFSSGRFEALVLAHHQNDQAETVLKRVLEGSHLPNLKGILPITKRGNMPIWRPFLTISKEVLSHFIEEREVIEDSTNLDPRYLRGRMRQEIFPVLSRAFGKEVIPSLARLGTYGAELEDYLEKQQIMPIEGPFGTKWDFSKAHPAEIRFTLHRFFTLSRPILDQIIEMVLSAKANQRVRFGQREVIVDRGCLYALKQTMPSFNLMVPLKEGTYPLGDWNCELSMNREPHPPNWWQGKFSLNLSRGIYQLGPPGGAFRKEWNKKRVPAFLRRLLPILIENGEPRAHFFSFEPPKNFSNMMSINIEIKEKVCYTDVKG